MNDRLPLPGADVEVQGVMGTFVGADLMSNGQVYFTIRSSASNVSKMAIKCGESLVGIHRINDCIVTVSVGACKWRNSPTGDRFDEECSTMLDHTVEDYQASEDVQGFQAMLSRRNMAWARSR